MNEYEIYHFALAAGFILIFAYSALSLLAVDMPGETNRGYNIARKTFGGVLLMWSIYVLSHFVFSLRYTHNYMAVIVSLSCYFKLIFGFETVLHSLLDKNYFSWSKVRKSMVKCAFFDIGLVINYFMTPKDMREITIYAFSVPLMAMMCVVAYNAHKRYKSVKLNIDNYYSDDTSESVVWMRNCIYMMLGLGFSGVAIPHGTAMTDAVTMLIAIVVLTYVLLSLNNYVIATNNIHIAVHDKETEVKHENSDVKVHVIGRAIDEWLKDNKYCESGITIDDIAMEIGSNRTYVSEYLNKHLNITFKNWIAQLRIEYSKTLLLEHPEYTLEKIAEMSGYARSSYISAFSKLTGDTPNKWRKDNLENYRKRSS